MQFPRSNRRSPLREGPGGSSVLFWIAVIACSFLVLLVLSKSNDRPHDEDAVGSLEVVIESRNIKEWLKSSQDEIPDPSTLQSEPDLEASPLVDKSPVVINIGPTIDANNPPPPQNRELLNIGEYRDVDEIGVLAFTEPVNVGKWVDVNATPIDSEPGIVRNIGPLLRIEDEGGAANTYAGPALNVGPPLEVDPSY